MPVLGLPLTNAELFPAINIIFPGWILLALLPGSKVTSIVVKLTCSILSVLYVALLYTQISQEDSKFSIADMNELKGLVELFKQEDAVFTGWVHFVIIDLMTGFWEATDAVRRGIPRIIMLPILFGTMMFGPCGVLLYMLVSLFFNVKVEEVKREKKD